MSALFDMATVENVNQVHVGYGQRCKNCSVCMKLEYGTGRRFFYCMCKPSNITGCGFKKIKANDPACFRFRMRSGIDKAVGSNEAGATINVNWCAKELS